MRQIHQSLEIHSTVMQIMGNFHRIGCGNSFPALQALAIHSLTTQRPTVTKARDSAACALLDRDVLLFCYIIVQRRQY